VARAHGREPNILSDPVSLPVPSDKAQPSVRGADDSHGSRRLRRDSCHGNTNQTGEAAGTAAVLALRGSGSVATVDPSALRRSLSDGGSIVL